MESNLRKQNQIVTDESNEAYLASIVETVRESLIILDKNFRVISANKSFYTTFNVKPEETEGVLIYKLGQGQWNIPALKKILEEILPTHNPLNDFRVEYTFPGIGFKVMLLNARQIKFKGKWKDRILLAIEDITPLHQGIDKGQLRKFHEDMAKLAAIVESSDDAIISKSIDGIITSWNKGAQRLYGYTAKETIGQPVAMLMPPNKKDDFTKIMQQIRKGKPIEHYETQRMTKNGQILDVSLTVSPLRDASGKLIGASKIARDITEKKRTERNLLFLADASKSLSLSLDYKTTLRSIAKLAVPDIADWCTVDILNENGELEQLAVTHKDPAKIKWAKALHKKFPVDMQSPTGIPNVIRTGHSEFYPNITEALIKQSVKSEEERLLLKKLSLTSVIIVPLQVERKTIGAISFLSTESKRVYTKGDLSMAEELAHRASLAIENAKLYSDSQKAVALRDDFISVASHELKTPVTSLKMYTQVLQRQLMREGNESITNYFAKIDDQVDKLSILINDLLSVSRVQHGQLEFVMETFDLNDLVKEAVEAIQTTARKHTIHITGEIPKSVYGDRYRIYQVITNLLTNAIKYSPKADRVLTTLTPGKAHAAVTIQDFGIGIDTEHQKNIFNQFYRVADPEERTFPGLGMGLYISRTIIERHNGEIQVVSKKGKGSQFTFTLPYTANR